MACHYVPNHRYVLANRSEKYYYEYNNVTECSEKCSNDPLCLGFLDRSPGGQNVCSWKSNEATLQPDRKCQNDYYKKIGNLLHNLFVLTILNQLD